MTGSRPVISEGCLTPQAKRREMERWRRLRREPLPRRRRGGDGAPDPEIFALCDALNELEGVCTLQSCAGHPAREGDGASRPGVIWLLAGHGVTEAFHSRSHLLAARGDLILAIGGRRRPCGCGQIQIVFSGRESGRLDRAADLILGFMRSLSPGPGFDPGRAHDLESRRNVR